MYRKPRQLRRLLISHEIDRNEQECEAIKKGSADPSSKTNLRHLHEHAIIRDGKAGNFFCAC